MGRRQYIEPEQVAEEEQPAESAAQPPEGTSTVEAPVNLSEFSHVEAHIPGWEQTEDGQMRNLRDFVVKGGAVPQGVVRSIEEALALEAQRVG